MIKLKDILAEKYEIDLEVGDTILRGKFKNKPVVVKEFGVDDKGQPTVNGKKMLSFRIKKLMPAKVSVKEGKAIPMDTPDEVAYLSFKKYIMMSNFKEINLKKSLEKAKGDGGKMFMTASALWYKWSRQYAKDFTHIKDKKKFGRALLVMLKKDDLIISKKGNKLTDLK